MTQAILNPVKLPSPLWPAEEEFARCVGQGIRCRVGDFNLPSKAVYKGSSANVIRHDVVRFFVYGGNEEYPVRGTAIILQGARIEKERRSDDSREELNDLNLEHGNIPYGLFFADCYFAVRVNLRHAKCAALFMDGSHLTQGMQADGMRTTRGGVHLRKGFVACSEVRLVGASINGPLDCSRGKFSEANSGKKALVADRLTAREVVLNHTSAKGGVQLSDMNINGNLACVGGRFFNWCDCPPPGIAESLTCGGMRFSNPQKDALTANRLTARGNVLLTDGFSAEGEVRLLGANIGGKLDCAGGTFINPQKYALNAERITTGGHVYLNRRELKEGKKPFTAEGRVRFANADIGGNFNCKGGQFLHSGDGSAIAAGGLKSRGAVFLSDGFLAKGNVALHVAQIGNFVCKECSDNSKKIVIDLSSTKAVAVDDDKKSWRQFKWILDGFTYDTFYGKYLAGESLSECLGWLHNRPKTRQVKIDGKYEEEELPFSPLPYEQAAKVLFGMGHDNDAREILLKKEQEITKRKKWWQRPYRWLWGEFAGYGYKPWKTLAWALAVVSIGWGVFSHTNDIRHIVPHQPAIIAKAENPQASPNERFDMESFRKDFPEYPEFNPLVFSADVFIPVFALHQEPFWYPIAGKKHVVAWLLSWPGWLGDHQEIFGFVIIGGPILWILFLVLVEKFFLGTPRASVGEGMIRFGHWIILRMPVILCLYTLGMVSPKHWYWLEIGFGWILTSLFLLSVTGLLRPRQSSGGKD